MKEFRGQEGVIYLAVLIVLVILFAAAAFFLFFKPPTPTSEKTLPVASGQPATQADEAFGEKKEYSNPFVEEKNPFDYLNE